MIPLHSSGRWSPPAQVLIDISELTANPLLTGIQRVEREVLARWPGPSRLVPCFFDPESGAFAALPEQAARGFAEDEPVAAQRARLTALAATACKQALVPQTPLLNLELFFDPLRAELYHAAAAEAPLFWLVYDFLPWLAPQWFPPGMARDLMPYLRALRSVPRVAFVSRASAAGYARLMHREASGPVFGLGADGLGLERQSFAPERHDIVMLGAVEPRKNLAAALAGFRLHRGRGGELKLVVIGRLADGAPLERRLLAEAQAEPWFLWLDQPADSVVRAALRRARALLCPSLAEGFGLPPIEALAGGIPVIATAGLPSLSDLPPLGQIRLGAAEAESIAAALAVIADDAAAARLWAETAGLALPGWDQTVARIAAWVQGLG